MLNMTDHKFMVNSVIMSLPKSYHTTWRTNGDGLQLIYSEQGGNRSDVILETESITEFLAVVANLAVIYRR